MIYLSISGGVTVYLSISGGVTIYLSVRASAHLVPLVYCWGVPGVISISLDVPVPVVYLCCTVGGFPRSLPSITGSCALFAPLVHCRGVPWVRFLLIPAPVPTLHLLVYRWGVCGIQYRRLCPLCTSGALLGGPASDIIIHLRRLCPLYAHWRTGGGYQ